MKFSAYKIEYKENGTSKQIPVKNILDHINSTPMQSRFLNYIRLDDVTHKNGYSLCKFTNERYSAPGIGRKNSSITDIPLQQGEYIAEETFILICHTRNIILVQYNLYGPKAFPIADYISIQGFNNNFTRDNFSISPIMNDDAGKQLIRKKNITNISLRISYNENTLSDIQETLGFNKDALPNETEKIELSIKSQKDKFINISKYLPFLDRSEVDKLRITGKDNDDIQKTVDLLNGKLEYEKNISRNKNSKRYLGTDVYTALEEAYKKFIDEGNI